MKIRLLAVAGFTALALSGCSSDPVAGVPVQLPAAALVRYVNAVPDTSALVFRFVDGDVEASPQFNDVAFRQFTAYQRARAGQRRLRVFTDAAPYGSNIAVATQQHVDTTFNFEVDKRYTIISYGFARTSGTPRHRLVIVEDVFPTTITAAQVGVRTIHGAANVGNVDVYIQPSEAPAGIAGVMAAAANVGPLARTAWVPLSARPVGPLLYRWDVAAAGSTAALTVSPNAGLPGVVGTAAQNALSGFQVGRSLITAIVFGPSVVGSRAPQGGEFANAGLRFLPDRHLDTTEP